MVLQHAMLFPVEVLPFVPLRAVLGLDGKLVSKLVKSHDPEVGLWTNNSHFWILNLSETHVSTIHVTYATLKIITPLHTMHRKKQ